MNSLVFCIGSEPNAVHHDINLDFLLKLLVFVLLGALLANRETKKKTPQTYQNKWNQSKFWCASTVHVSVNNQVCVSVCACVRVHVCRSRCVGYMPKQTHTTHIVSSIACAWCRGISYRNEKLFDYKTTLTVCSNVTSANSCVDAPTGRAQ